MGTKLRSLKNQRLALSASGDEIGAKQTQKKINELQAKYRKFSNNNNLLYDTKRASVEGYRRISVKGLQDLENLDILKRITKGELSLEINIEKQNRPILGTDEYKTGRSYFNISTEQLQDIINRNYTTGKVYITNSGKQIKEVIFIENNVDVDINDDFVENLTNGIKIHYSKTGTHAVPYRKKKDYE